MLGIVARMVCAAPGLILSIGVVLAVVGAVVMTLRWNVVNNTSDLLSDKYPSKMVYNELKKDFGSDYRYIILIQSPDIAQNRQVADELGTYLPTLAPQITQVLSKIDYSAIRPRLLFTLETDQLKKIADEVESEVSAQQTNAKQSEQIALDLNSILNEANLKFNDKYLREKKQLARFRQVRRPLRLPPQQDRRPGRRQDPRTGARRHLQRRQLRRQRRRGATHPARVLQPAGRPVDPRLRLHR